MKQSSIITTDEILTQIFNLKIGSKLILGRGDENNREIVWIKRIKDVGFKLPKK